ncbi:hypothetical protein [Polluticaenibacter yanchengensis]|uniref:YtxH domain-containing protein n=1 Tax=Polluticaenibacter yanchengensis TaxID=3014562 RepID=A0ABT4URM0_9BACT|nr:hypothetical protein [Chitinophagaceae bacterium LY-5]
MTKKSKVALGILAAAAAGVAISMLCTESGRNKGKDWANKALKCKDDFLAVLKKKAKENELA